MRTCEAVVRAATRWEPAEHCEADASDGADFCPEHLEMMDNEGMEEALWEALTGR